MQIMINKTQMMMASEMVLAGDVVAIKKWKRCSMKGTIIKANTIQHHVAIDGVSAGWVNHAFCRVITIPTLTFDMTIYDYGPEIPGETLFTTSFNDGGSYIPKETGPLMVILLEMIKEGRLTSFGPDVIMEYGHYFWTLMDAEEAEEECLHILMADAEADP